MMSGSGSSVFGLWEAPPDPGIVARARLFFGAEAWIEPFSLLDGETSPGFPAGHP